MDKFRAKVLLEQKRDQLHIERNLSGNIQKSQSEDINPFDQFEEDIQKGKPATIGETRMWGDKKMRKQANGEWVEVSEKNGGLTKIAHETVKRFTDVNTGDWGQNKEGVEISKLYTTNKITAKEYIDRINKLDQTKDDHQESVKDKKSPIGKLTLHSERGKGMNEVRYWKDEKGNFFYDPHPKIDHEPGDTLIHTEEDKVPNARYQREDNKPKYTIGTTYHLPAPEGGEAVDMKIISFKDNQYKVETTNKEGRKGTHTFNPEIVEELVNLGKSRSGSKEGRTDKESQDVDVFEHNKQKAKKLSVSKFLDQFDKD